MQPSPLVDRLVPGEMLEASPDTLRRARLTLWVIAGMVPVLLGCAVVSLAVRGPNPLALELGLGTVGLLAAVPVLRVARSLTAAAAVVVLTLLITVVVVAGSGYGLLSPALPALVLAPVIGFVLGGTPVGLGVALVAFVLIEVMWLAPGLGYEPPLEATGPVHRLVFAHVLALVVWLETTFLYFYDRAWRDAVARSDAANAALAEARDDALRADELKGRFLANMSHELRTPLSAILGYTELMLEEQPEHADLARIHRSGRHLLALVDDLLDLARIEEERLELDLRPVRLHDVVTETLEAVRPMLDGRPVALDTAIPEGLLVRADPGRLRQVLLNLLGNACKFTEQGTVEVRARRAGAAVLIEVADTGRGMTAEEQRLCFEPFEQLGPDHSGGGAGLGLAISRRLARMMEGEVDVESEPGVGTTFQLRLRAAA